MNEQELTKEDAMERILNTLRELSASAAERKQRHDDEVERKRELEAQILMRAIQVAREGLEAEASVLNIFNGQGNGARQQVSDRAVRIVSIRPSSKIPGETLYVEVRDDGSEDLILVEARYIGEPPNASILIHDAKRNIHPRDVMDVFSLEHVIQGLVDVLVRSKGREASAAKIAKERAKLEAVLQLLH